MSRTHSKYALHTPLDPLHAGVLAALALRESPAKPAAHRVIERQQRDDLERLCPGAWDQLAELYQLPDETPRQFAARVAARAGELLRARSRKESAQ